MSTLQTEKYDVATALDPRFKTLQCIATERREGVWDEILKMGRELNLEQAPRIAPVSQKKRKLCFHADNTLVDSEQPRPTLAGELAVYKSLAELDDDFANPLEWWKIHQLQLPQLAKLAMRLLCVPATSVPCERVFSTAGLVVNKLRSSLNPENVNILLCLQNWLKRDMKA